MKEHRIEVIQRNNTDEKILRQINKKFTERDFLTQQNIDKIAENLSELIKKKLSEIDIEKESIDLIIKTLNPEEIFNLLIADQSSVFRLVDKLPKDPVNSIRLIWTENDKEVSETISKEEIQPFLEKIQKEVLNKLSGLIPENARAYIANSISKRVFDIGNNLLYKQYSSIINHPEINQKGTEDYLEALNHLSNLQEKSQFIYNNTLTIDTQHGQSILKKINLTNLSEILKDTKEYPLNRILGYFIDIIEGHKFLIKNGLILTDNQPRNLGVDKDTDKGILFDLDGLRKKEIKTNYVAIHNFLPPERMQEVYENKPSPITEKNIVYELGLALSDVIYIYERTDINWDDTIQGQKLSDLIKKMLEKTPEKRPPLEEVQKELANIRLLN